MRVGKYVTYLWTWPQDILMWVFWILPFWALWGRDLRWLEGCLCFNLKEDSWPARTWYAKWGGTSIGHAIMFNTRIPQTTEPLDSLTVHELSHVKWFETVMFTSFMTAWIPFIFLGAHGHWMSACICGSIVWVTGHTLQGLGGFFVAWVLGGRAYRDSYHEQAAYAIGFKYSLTGKRDT